MSSDWTQPPSITPKQPRPAAGSRTRSGAADEPVLRPPSRPVSGDQAPSVGARLKRAAQVVTEAATHVVPTRSASPEEDELRLTVPRSREATSGTTGSATAARTAPAAAPAATSGPRRVRLALARIDPWSVMKLSFLLSVAIGIMIVVAAAVVWYALDGLEVFTKVNDAISQIVGDTGVFDVLKYLAFDRVISLATMVAVVDVVLLTALGTIGAFLYNIVAALVGGVQVTLTDD